MRNPGLRVASAPSIGPSRVAGDVTRGHTAQTVIKAVPTTDNGPSNGSQLLLPAHERRANRPMRLVRYLRDPPGPRRREIERRIATWTFNRRSLAVLRRQQHVVCIGDSHVTVLSKVHVPGVRFQVRRVVGATASGLLNEKSATRTRRKLLQRLGEARRWQSIVIQLGEVDCGYLIWRRAERYGLDIEEQLELSLATYSTFLTEVLGRNFREVIVLSAPLPTIGDARSEWEGSVASARKDITATQAERTALTLRFNDRLKARCESLGVTFVDVTTGQLDPATGLIDTRFVRMTNRNHHLADAPYGALIASELGAVLARSP